MDMEKSDRLRSMLEEAMSPLIKKMEMLEGEIKSLKEEQKELIKLIEKK